MSRRRIVLAGTGTGLTTGRHMVSHTADGVMREPRPQERRLGAAVLNKGASTAPVPLAATQPDVQTDVVLLANIGTLAVIEVADLDQVNWPRLDPGVQALMSTGARVGIGSIRIVQTKVSDAGGRLLAKRRKQWAIVVLAVVASSRDTTNLAQWASVAQENQSRIKRVCHNNHVTGKQSLDFARLLRAVVRNRLKPAMPEQLLNVVDRRTLSRLLRDAGSQHADKFPDLETFLREQTFIRDRELVEAVRSSLGGRLGDETDTEKEVSSPAG